jgi:blue copper oxidase
MEHRYPRWFGIVALLLCLGGLRTHAQTFVNQLPIPNTVDNAVVNLSLDVESHNFSPQAGVTDTLDTLVKTFAFNLENDSVGNSYLGPTLIWRPGRHQSINVKNNLTQTATVHWHGAHVPPSMDGGPHQPIAPGATWPVHFDVMDTACTLWYHPHAHDETFAQVEMGLSAIIIVDDSTDPVRNALPHRYNVDDFPIIIQERTFEASGDPSFIYQIDTNQHGGPPSRTIVNGVVNPYLEVPPQLVRFRILDGSSRMAYRLGIGQTAGNPLPFQLIASDDGYLGAPITVDSFLTGPGIRNEIVFDFSPYAGQNVYLMNMIQTASGSGIIGIGPPEQSTAPFFLEFRVGAVAVPPLGTVPTFPALNIPATASYTKQRTKDLIGQGGPTNPVPFSINGNQFLLDVVNDTIMLDSTEIWHIYNVTNVAHPFHIHDIHFFVTHVEIATSGSSDTIPIPAEMMGPKDNVLVQKDMRVTFVTTFRNFATLIDSDSAYMYHCHILTHEDGYYAPGAGGGPSFRDMHGMMQQFVVWNGITVQADEQELADGMVLYPNPAYDELHLKGESTEPSTVRVYDLSGRTLVMQTLAPFAGTTTIPVEGLSRGMVLVEWTSAAGTHTRKVVLR